MLEGEPGPDHPTQIAVDGDQLVVTIVSDEGVITGFATDDSGRFQTGEPSATGIQFLGLGGVARFGEGWVALGSGGLLDGEELLLEVRAFRSADGRTWSEVDATGFEVPADVTGQAAVDGGLVGVGTLRTADDPARGGFLPVAWHTADGVGWTTVPLPTDGGTEGYVQSLAVTGDEVLAVGAVDGHGVMWSSTDRGASWAIVERDGIPALATLSHIATQGEVLVASGTTPEGAQLLLRSTDGGGSTHRASASTSTARSTPSRPPTTDGSLPSPASRAASGPGPGPPARPSRGRTSPSTRRPTWSSWARTRCPSQGAATGLPCTSTAGWTGSTSAASRGSAPTTDPTPRPGRATRSRPRWSRP